MVSRQPASGFQLHAPREGRNLSKPIAGGEEQLILSTDGNAEPDRFSPDGRFLLFDFVSKANGTDVWALPLFGERKAFPVVHSSANEDWGVLSPNGKWVAYASDESGRGEIYVVRFPEGTGKQQVSTGGGIIPLWPLGKDLFYLEPDWRVQAVEVDTQSENLRVGKSREMLGGRRFGNATGVCVSADGKRWLIAFSVAEPNASPLILMTNWTAPLKQ